MKNHSEESLFSFFKLRLPFVIIYLAISFGIALQIGGGNWDIIWHSTNNVESFLSPPHTVLYSGVALVIIFTLIGMTQYPRNTSNINGQNNISFKQSNIKSKITLISPNFLYSLIGLPYPLKLIAAGTIIEIFSGMFDNWWHNSFGFDGLLSPPHLLLTAGMMLSIYGTLLGIYKLRSNDIKKNPLLNVSLIISYAVAWMVSVNLIFMFSLPYSQGQYFDFNPHPLASVILSTVLIPFVSSMIFFSAAKILKEVSFRFTFIVLTFIIIHSTATIISNSYFISLYPLYLLNIVPAIISDFIIMLYNKNSREIKGNTDKTILSKNKAAISASVIISMFFMTMFFPWSVNAYKEYFGIDMNTLESIEVFNQLLYTVIIPIIIPVSILTSILGSYTIIQLFNRYNRELLVTK